MKNKLIALMAVIPLIVMFTIMTFTGAASVAVDIPVSGVTVTVAGAEDGILTVDMAEYEYDKHLQVDVAPVNAANRAYDLEFSAVEGSAQGSIEVEEDGLIVPLSTGAVKVTAVTRDGGFRASVIVNVTSTKAIDAEFAVADREGAESYEVTPSALTGVNCEVTVPGGAYFLTTSTLPASVAADVTYTVSPYLGEGVEGGLEIHPVTGLMQARLSGRYLVTAAIDPAVDGKESATLLVTVDCGDGFTVNGVAEKEQALRLPRAAAETVVYAQSGGEITVDAASEGTTARIEELGGGRYAVAVAFDDIAKEKGASLTLSTSGESVTLTFSFGESVTEIYGRYPDSADGFLQMTGVTATYAAVSEPASAAGTTYRFELTGDAARIISQDPDTGLCRIEALGSGEAEMVLYVTENGIESEAERVRIAVSDGYSSFTFSENAESHGIGGVYAVGGLRYAAGGIEEENPALGLKVQRGAQTVSIPAEEVIFLSSDPDTAELIAAGEGFAVRVKGTGRVTLTAEWRYNEAFGADVTASITLDVVADGVNVTDYASLMAATDAKKPVVLQEDVMLGEYMFDEDGFLKPGADLSRFVRQIETTADWTYYANRGYTHPTVNYIVEFTADVYGNGKCIDGDYITQVTPMVSASASVFKGPLDFVAVDGMASVKAQDNIVFLVRTDDITIDNVVLRGCSDESLYDDGKMELSYLNTVGTVLEVMSDCRVINSRIMNGRTGVRAFGREGINAVVSAEDPVNVKAERITVELESCIVQNAREFLVKLGTNRKVRGTFSGTSINDYDKDKLEPSLTAGGITYAPRTDENLADKNFTENFLLTDLTLKNCALYNSGLFSVGFESCFAGPMLSLDTFDGWSNMAGTSYSAVLRLVGDVRMYDWKSLATVDSSTLIEMPNGADAQTAFLQLNMSQMLNKVCSYGGEKYEDIIYTENGEQFVHGGIAMYGGGKNYGMVDLTAFTGEKPTQYSVNLSVLAEGEPPGNLNNPLYAQGTMLPLAAGTQDFRFFMYDAASKFGLQAQRDALADGTAFSFIKPAMR